MLIKSNDDLAKLICKNIFFIDDVDYMPLKREMLKFLKDAEELEQDFLEDGEIKAPMCITKKNVYWKWRMDDKDEPTEWLVLEPFLQTSDKDKEKTFDYMAELAWMTSEGGDGTVLNDYGLLGKSWEVKELNLQKNNVEENLRVIRSNNLYSVFGLQESDLV